MTGPSVAAVKSALAELKALMSVGASPASKPKAARSPKPEFVEIVLDVKWVPYGLYPGG